MDFVAASDQVTSKLVV